MIPIEELYCALDDFCKSYEKELKFRQLPKVDRKRNRSCALSLSEIMTIVVLFHFSHYRTFKDFYLNYMIPHGKRDFPKLVSYSRFVELMPYAFMPLCIFLNGVKGQHTGKYYVDSTKLQVCDNFRISRHRVFKGLAARGKTSTGWFFGFKLHIVINHIGEIVKFTVTPGNADDRSVVEKLTEGLSGWLFGDKGYIGKSLAERLKKKGIEMITRPKKNMLGAAHTLVKKQWLDKRGVIESVIDQLKGLLHIQHTRHRSPTNFSVNLIAGLVAYLFKPKKPGVSFKKHIMAIRALTSN